MKRIYFLLIAATLVLYGCGKISSPKPDPLLTKLQGTWTRDCGCLGDYYKFSGDTIYLSTSTPPDFQKWGYVLHDTAYLLDTRYGGVEGSFYDIKTALSINGSGLLYMQPSILHYDCADTACADQAYHRVN